MRELNVRHMWLVAKREYLEIVRNKWFLIMTVLTPALVIAWSVVPSMLMMKTTRTHRTVTVVAEDKALGQALVERMSKGSTTKTPTMDATKSAEQQDRDGSIILSYTAVLSTELTEENRKALQGRIDSGSIDGFLWVDHAALDAGEINYTARYTNDMIELRSLQDMVRETIRRHRGSALGLNDTQTSEVLRPYGIDAVRWQNGKASNADFRVLLFSVIILGMTMFMSVMLYGIGVMRAVLEEKSNKIMEVLMSTLTPTELMVGKIVGVGAAGLSQLAIWIAMGSILAVPGVVAASSAIHNLDLGVSAAVYFAIFFFLGFFLYSTMCAAVGSIVSTEREAQQIQQFVMMPLIASFAAIFLAIRAPNDMAITVMSMIPFCAPVVMYMRIVIQTPPFWQIALSIGIMLVTIAVMFWVAGRIYRVGVLMYGKRATLPEIIKWIKYA
ncbi:MAG: ABC transporter permease [Acidobacteriales bacterium]|nr:ABC transporter permease [Terriglobales bacterium]